MNPDDLTLETEAVTIAEVLDDNGTITNYVIGKERVFRNTETGSTHIITYKQQLRVTDGTITGIEQSKRCRSCNQLFSSAATSRCTSCGNTCCKGCLKDGLCASCYEKTYWQRFCEWFFRV